MRHLISIFLTFLFSIAAAADNHIMVKFKEGATRADINAILTKYGLRTVKTLSEIRVHVTAPANGSLPARTLSKLQGDSSVQYAERNGTLAIEAFGGEGASLIESEHVLGGLHIEEAWEITKGSKNVVVAVIDTGVRMTHQELRNQIWTNAGEIAGNGIDDDGNGYIDDMHGWDFSNRDNDPSDDHNHGSHVAGIIGAELNGVGIAGVNQHVSIMAIKFLNASGSGTWEGAVESVLYAANNGAHIINASWGAAGEESQTLRDAIQYAHERNVLFVAAAGNSAKNTDIEPHYPSTYRLPNIISVASTGVAWNSNFAIYTNYGRKTVHVAAPGEYILSAGGSCDGCYVRYRGTSMAAPHVAGVAALVLSVHPNLRVEDLRNAVLNGTRRHGKLSAVSTSARSSALLTLEQFNAGPQVWPKLLRVHADVPLKLTAHGFDGEVSWEVDKSARATVTADGYLLVQKWGKFNIRAVSGDQKSAPVQITAY